MMDRAGRTLSGISPLSTQNPLPFSLSGKFRAKGRKELCRKGNYPGKLYLFPLHYGEGGTSISWSNCRQRIDGICKGQARWTPRHSSPAQRRPHLLYQKKSRKETKKKLTPHPNRARRWCTACHGDDRLEARFCVRACVLSQTRRQEIQLRLRRRWQWSEFLWIKMQPTV